MRGICDLRRRSTIDNRDRPDRNSVFHHNGRRCQPSLALGQSGMQPSLTRREFAPREQEQERFSGRHDERCVDLAPDRFFAIRSLLADDTE